MTDEERNRVNLAGMIDAAARAMTKAAQHHEAFAGRIREAERNIKGAHALAVALGLDARPAGEADSWDLGAGPDPRD